MNKTCLIGTAAAALLLGACSGMSGGSAATAQKPSGNPAALDNAVATVNGKPISKNALRNLMAEIASQNNDQNVSEEKAVESLISRELLRQEAERLNLEKHPEVEGRIENVNRDVLAQADVDNFRKGLVVSDEEVRKEYDAKLSGADLTEFKARHILLGSEQEARDALASLKKGAKFADLAKKISRDPSAKQNGGDLGWFNPQQMVPEFANALAVLKNGETASAPVKTQFGWHVVQREDSRKQEPPPFETVKEPIRNILVGQKLQRHIEDMKDAAKIENTVSGKN